MSQESESHTIHHRQQNADDFSMSVSDTSSSRRGWLQGMGWLGTSWLGMSWLTPLGQLLAGDLQERPTVNGPPGSLIILWLAGGPSQLETFDPHTGTEIAGGTTAIPTSVSSVRLAQGLEATAEQMQHMALLRNVVSREGDHERATYYGKTGYRPNPAILHPALGAVLCHQLPEGRTEIPRHVSIFPDAWPSRGGYLGNQYDAYLIGDPHDPIPDVRSTVASPRFAARWQQLEWQEAAFQARYASRPQATTRQHRDALQRATTMMSSQQLAAFDLSQVPREERLRFGDTPFGRGCLAATRLIDVGVRCVEVTLAGWDSHVKNHEIHTNLKSLLDPALAGLISTLHEKQQLDHTVVLCAGEFGRTPQINPAGGRDHWPHGFSMALAGGRLRRGVVHGLTDPGGAKIPYEQGVTIADVHATLLTALGIPPTIEIQTSLGRPMKLSDGAPILGLLNV